jgi:hypothetical protein
LEGLVHIRSRQPFSLSLLAAAGVCLAACSAPAKPPADVRPPSAPSTATTPGPSPADDTSAANPAAEVARIAVGDQDLTPGFTVRLVPHGDGVRGQVTLANCGYTFTTESFRVARRHVQVLTPTGQFNGVDNEVVAYDTPTHAQRALAEWMTSVSSCSHGVVLPPTSVGEPPLRIVSESLTTSPQLPVTPNAETAIVIEAKGQNRRVYALHMIQVRGAVLDIVGALSPVPFTSADTSRVRTLAIITGRRMGDGLSA